MPGGCSWTKNWLEFDNSYFKRLDSMIKYSDENIHYDNNSFPSETFTSPSNNHKYQNSRNSGDDTDEEEDDSELLWLPTDQALYDSPEFRPYFIKYANSKLDFFDDYSHAHVRMSELGAKFKPSTGIFIPAY